MGFHSPMQSIVAVLVLALVAILAYRFGALRRPPCGNCGAPAPFGRRLRTFSQMLWGGWTCRECGADLDWRGKPRG